MYGINEATDFFTSLGYTRPVSYIGQGRGNCDEIPMFGSTSGDGGILLDSAGHAAFYGPGKGRYSSVSGGRIAGGIHLSMFGSPLGSFGKPRGAFVGCLRVRVLGFWCSSFGKEKNDGLRDDLALSGGVAGR